MSYNEAAFRRLHAEGHHDAYIGEAFARDKDWARWKRKSLGLTANHPSGGQVGLLHFPGKALFSIGETTPVQESSMPWLSQDANIDIRIPESPLPPQDDWFRLCGDVAIISDLHIPCHSARVVRAFCGHAEALGIRRCVISGDFMDMNQVHPKRGNIQHDRTLNDDFDLAREVLQGMFSYFDEIVYCFGNHDSWLDSHMRRIYDGKRLIRNEFHEFGDRLSISDFEICEVENNGVRLVIPHGCNFSGANPLGVAQRLSAKFECAIVLGHQHIHATGRSVSGKHQVVCMGGAHSPKRLKYALRSPKTHPVMTQGYCLFKSGVLIPVDMTDGSD